MHSQRMQGLPAVEFFARDLPGCSKSSASTWTGIAWSTIHDIARGKTDLPRLETLRDLETWSRIAGKPYGVYISPARTLGFEEPASQQGRPQGRQARRLAKAVGE